MTECASYSRTNFSSALTPSCSAGYSITIFLCIFNGLNYARSSSNGGAIYISNANSILSVGQSFFVSCSAANGGAVYIEQSYTDSYDICCFYGCLGSSGCQAVYSHNLGSHSHTFELNSAIFCPPAYASYYDVVALWGGSSTYDQNNMSNDCLSGHGCVQFYQSTQTSISLSTFVSNIMSIVFDFNSVVSCSIANSNIVNTSQPSSIYSIIYDYNATSCSVTNSYFINNTFTRLSYYGVAVYSGCSFWGCSFTASSGSQPQTASLHHLSSWICIGVGFPTQVFSAAPVKINSLSALCFAFCSFVILQPIG